MEKTGDKFIDGVIELAQRTGTRVDINMISDGRYGLNMRQPYDWLYFLAHPPASHEVKRVIFSPPATVVLWADGSKTIVKVHDEDYDEEKGFAMAVCKKLYGRMGTERILREAQRQEAE
jgi:hypothetical protein